MSSLTTNHNSVSLNIGSNNARIVGAASSKSKKKGNKKQFTFAQKLDMLKTKSYPDDLDPENIRNWKENELTIRSLVTLGYGDSLRIVSFI